MRIRRVLAMLLAAVMVVGMVPASPVSAETAPVALELDKSILCTLDSGAVQEYTYTAAESGYYVFFYDERRFGCEVNGLADLVTDLGPYGTVLNSGYIENGVTATFRLTNLDSLAATAEVSIEKAPAITGIVFESNEANGLVGDVLRIPFSVEPEYARGSLSWAVDDPNVAQVTATSDDSVEVALLADGTATLTATADSGATQSILLQVELPTQLQMGINQVDLKGGEENRVVFTPAADGYYYFRMEDGPQELNIFDPNSEEVLIGSWNSHDLNSAWGEDGQYFCVFLNVGVQYSASVYEYMGEDRTLELEIGQMSTADSVGNVKDQRLAFTDTIPVAFPDLAPTEWVNFTWITDTSVAIVEKMDIKGLWLHGVNPGNTDVMLNITLADGSVETKTFHVIVDGIDEAITLGETKNVTVQPQDVYIYEFTPDTGASGTYYYCAKLPEGVSADIVGGWIHQYPNGEYLVMANDYDYQTGTTHMLRLWSELDEAADVEVQLLSQEPAQGIQLPDTLELELMQNQWLMAELQPMNTEFFQWSQWDVDDPTVVEIYSGWEEGGATGAELVGLKEGTAQVSVTVGMPDGTTFTDTCQVTVKGLEAFPVGTEQSVTVGEYSQKCFALTPSVSGCYYLKCDQGGHIRFADEELEFRDYWEDGFSYRIYALEAGETYTLVLENGEGMTLDVNVAVMPADAPDRIYCDDEKLVAVGGVVWLNYSFEEMTQFALPSVSIADPGIVAVQHVDMHHIWLEGLAEGETDLTITAGNAVHTCRVKVQAATGALSQGVNQITLPAGSTQYYTFAPGDVQRYVIWTARTDGEVEMNVQCPGYQSEFATDSDVAARVALDDPNGMIVVALSNNRDESTQIDVNLEQVVSVDGLGMPENSYQTIPGQMIRVELFAKPVNSEGLDAGMVTWDVADPSIVQPEDMGGDYCELLALTAGTTVVTAQLELEDGSVFTASATVEVIQPPSLEEDTPLDITVTDQLGTYLFVPNDSGLYNFSVESMDVSYDIRRTDGVDQDWTWNDDHENGIQHLISELETGVEYAISIGAETPIDTTITVSRTPVPGQMWLHHNTLLVRPGGTFDLMAGFGPVATLEIVSWSSDNTDVVDIGYTGMAHAQLLFLQEGTAIITATTDSGLTAQCEVTVSNNAPVGPWIEEQPQDQTVAEGETAVFRVGANCLGGMWFEWYVSTDDGSTWSAIPDSDTPEWAVEVTPDMDGWQYRCLLRDDEGNTVTSDAAVLHLETMIAEGTCGDNFVWQVWNNGWLYIYGNGPMPDFDPSSGNHAPWHDHRDKVHRVEMGSRARSTGVTSIGAYAFADMTLLEEIIIPATVTSIGTAAFDNTALSVVNFIGTQAQWEQIDGVEAVPEVEVVYDYGQEAVDPFEQIDDMHFRMVADLCAPEDFLEIPEGVEVDLNGHTLEVAGVVGFGMIVDSSEGCTGRVITQELILAEMAAMPIYDSANGCYRFFDYELNPLGCRQKADGCVTFGLAIDFSCEEAYALLAQSENSGVQVRFGLLWQEESLEFAISDDLLRQYAALQLQYPGLRSAMMLNVTGVDTLEPGTELCVEHVVDTAGDVSANGDSMSYIVP